MPRIPFSQVVMGMNSRNARLIKVVNPPSAIRLVNSKVVFKRRLRDNDIPTPETYDTIYSARSFNDIPWRQITGKSIVIKPDHGFGGNGILVLRWSKKKNGWMRGDHQYSEEDIVKHTRDILDGQYSKGNVQDRAVIEEMVVGHKFFRDLGSTGLADIRVVVYNGVPLMAMLRLPTEMSGGRANLHAGGLGVGIDIGSGLTTTAIHNNQLVAVHPETAESLSDHKIPKWRKVLEVAIATQQISGLGYAGIDIVIDKHGRVMVLEANARPGLAIQTANLAGLNERVARVRNLKVRSVEHGIRLAAELFSLDAPSEARLKRVSKPVIGPHVAVKLINPTTAEAVTVQAKVDTGAQSSSIDIEVARQIGFGKDFDYFAKLGYFKPLSLAKADSLYKKYEEQGVVPKKIPGAVNYIIRSASGATLRIGLPIRVVVAGKEINAIVNLTGRSHMKYSMLLGAADLKYFYVDVNG